MNYKYHRAASFVVVVALAAATAVQLRAAWDVLFAVKCAHLIEHKLYSRRTQGSANGTCPSIDGLASMGRKVQSSPSRVVFVSHGLLCSVRRCRSGDLCRIVIRIGRPTIYYQCITAERDGSLCAHRSVITGGALRSLLQNTVTADE